MAHKPVVLIIRDGWGLNPGGKKSAEKDGNAVELADTPFHDAMEPLYPKGHLSASGLDVGLPEGQMGNSEVGHLNLGAGRIVYQDLTRINKAISDDTLKENKVLQEALAQAKGKRLHFVGLVSDGGVHSHQDQLIALAKVAKQSGCDDIMVHAITDGRDTSPTGGQGYVSYVEDELAKYDARIATVIGRYYAMDRDQRWERSKLAWEAIVHGKGKRSELLASEAIAEQYVVSHLKDYDLVIINFANPDMVGHTGVVEAAKKAVTRIDDAVKAVTEETLRLGGKLLITADHGNCEFMKNADGSPHTAHTTNLVHLWYVAEDASARKVSDGILADVAPTLLDMMGIDAPEEMTGKSLIE